MVCFIEKMWGKRANMIILLRFILLSVNAESMYIMLSIT